ncbi:MAG: complement resistance protein TraT [Alphaproteobacteria bacterium]
MAYNTRTPRTRSLVATLLILGTVLIVTGCAKTGIHNRLGLVKDPNSGFLFGSTVEKNFITDASLFKNRKIKVRTRNTSGDLAFNLNGFSENLKANFANKGYQPVGVNSDDFGLLLDVNIMYSGHAESSLANQFAYLGASVGAIRAAKSKSNYARVTGPIAGATFGSVLGSFITTDTYIIVASVSFAVIKGGKKKTGKTITFSRSYDPKWDDEDRQEKEDRRTRRSLKKVVETGVSVFAGGTSVSQAEISRQVRERIIRILGDII